jgi:hypothetical protein
MTSGYQYKAKLAFVVLVDDGWLRIQICTKKERGNMNLIVNKLNGKCMRELTELLIRKQIIVVNLSLQPS